MQSNNPRPVDPKFQVEGVAPSTLLLLTKLSIWSFVWYKNAGTTFFRFVTNHVFDRQTDGQTEFSSLDSVCIPCSAVKSIFYAYLHRQLHT